MLVQQRAKVIPASALKASGFEVMFGEEVTDKRKKEVYVVINTEEKAKEWRAFCCEAWLKVMV